MKQISEIITDHIDDENLQYIDAYFDEDADSEGKTIAVVDRDTKKVIFFDNLYRGDEQVKEAIKEIHDSIVIKKPVVVVKILGGCVRDVFSDTDLELEVLDFDTEGSSEEDREHMKKIPDSYGKLQDAFLDCGGILEVNTDEAKAVFKALNS
jgi:hypothetical protein